MAKAKTAKGTNVFVPVLSANSSNCSIKVDKHLDALLDGTRIEEPCEQMAVCEALCNIGLADHKMYVDDTSGSQEHHYTSTKSMRGLAKEWLYSTKHWGIPGDCSGRSTRSSTKFCGGILANPPPRIERIGNVIDQCGAFQPRIFLPVQALLVIPIAARTPPLPVYLDGQARAPGHPAMTADKSAELGWRYVFGMNVLQRADPAALLLEIRIRERRLNQNADRAHTFAMN